MTTNQLLIHILEFMAVLHECYSQTTHSYDLSLHAADLATAMGYIVRLQNGIELSKAIEHILGP